MDVREGQVVWVSWAHCTHSDETATVDRCTVVAVSEEGDAVVRTDRGNVRVINPWSGQKIHATEAEAWRACAAWLRVRAAAIVALAHECVVKSPQEAIA